MSKLTVILAALVACLGVSALASASAMATCGGGADTTEEWCRGGSPLAANEMAELSTVAENAKGILTSSALGLQFECTTLEGASPLILRETGKPEAMASSLTFGKCKNIGGATKCSLVGETIKTNAIKVTNVKELAGTEVTTKFEPETGSTFAIIELSGASCSVAGKNSIKGKATVTAPTGQTESEKQEIKANTGAGELEVGSSPATLEGHATLKLASGAKWSWD